MAHTHYARETNVTRQMFAAPPYAARELQLPDTILTSCTEVDTNGGSDSHPMLGAEMSG